MRGNLKKYLSFSRKNADIFCLQYIRMSISLEHRHYRWQYFCKCITSQALLSFDNFYTVFLLVLFENMLLCFASILLTLSQQILPCNVILHTEEILCWLDRNNLKLFPVTKLNFTRACNSSIWLKSVSAYSSDMTAAPMTNDRKLQTRQSCKGQWILRRHLLSYLQVEQFFIMSNAVFTVQ